MAWDHIIGHDEVLERFRRSAANGRLASTFLFVGPAGIGKRTFAFELARALLCETNPETQLEACGHCPSCQQVDARTHPDLDFVGKPSDKNFIPLDLLIGDDEHRMREGLCHNISLKPYRGGRKIAIIDDADYLNQEGANALLKTLEEPPPRSVIILIGTSEQRQLPTIRSRSQVVRFQPLTNEQVEQLLVEKELVDSPSEARDLSRLSGGSLEQALQFNDSEIREFRGQLLEFLCSSDANPFVFAKELSQFVDSVAKEAPPRRARLKTIASMAVDFYRELLVRLGGHEPTADELLAKSAEKALRGGLYDMDSAAACLDRCLDIFNQVDANANLATLIEAWIDDLMLLTPQR